VDKLKRYQALGTPEVWFWEDGMLRLYRLRDREYHQIARSEWLPDLDLELFR
jgi:Uma2 family endonuclease